jgi:hypothetical protein
MAIQPEEMPNNLCEMEHFPKPKRGEGVASESGLELIRGPGFDGLAVHLLEFDAVEMLGEDVQVGDLMQRLGSHRHALRSVPIRVFKLAAMGLRIAVHNVVGALGLNGVEGKNGGPDVAVHIFRLAGLNAHFEKPDMIVFKEDFVVPGRRVDRFHGLGPMPDHAGLALCPGGGCESDRGSGEESGDKGKLAGAHVLSPSSAVG